MSIPNFRNEAGSVQLHGGTGNILHMVGLANFIEAYKADTTFRIQTPETVDPDNTNPNAPWVVSRIDGIGASSLAVARVLLQGHEMLKSGVFANGFSNDAVLNQLHSCKEQLVVCEQIASRVIRRVEVVLVQIQSDGIDRDNRGRALNPFPQTPELVADTTAFLINTKRAVAEATALIAAAMDLSVQGPNFRILGERLTTSLGPDAELTKYVLAQEPTVKYLVDLRNLQEHPNTVHTVVRDFHVLPDGSICAPVLHFSDRPLEPLHETLRFCTTYLVHLTEAVFIHSVMSRLVSSFPFAIEEIPDAEVMSECPIKYRLSIAFSALRVAPVEGNSFKPKPLRGSA